MIPTARIGALVFDGGDGHDGFTIRGNGLTGWADGVTQRRDETVFPQAHGSFDTPGFGSARVVSIQGLCFADSDARLGWRKSQLTGLLSDGGMDRLVVDYQGVVSWADVRLAAGSPILFTDRVPGRIADYQIQFWAPDPRRYGATNTFTGVSATIWHYGNFAAAPVLTVSGASAGGYTVTGPGGALYVVTAALVAGHPHVIDMATGLLSIDGVVQSGVVSTATTWTVPPGQQVTVSVSAGTLSVAVLDTYM